MSEPRAPKPSPPVGEGAERQSREAGEGALATNPSPGRSLRSRPPSPARGEGDERRDRWFWYNDVLTNLEGVLISILETLHGRTPHPDRAARGRPSPTRGEGNEPAARAADLR